MIQFLKGKDSSPVEPNIFVQETEPEIKEGIWFKSNLPYNKIILDKSAGESPIEFSDNDTESLVPNDLYTYVAVYANGYIYIFSKNGNIPCYKYDVINKTYTEMQTLTSEQRDAVNYQGIYIEERNEIVLMYQTKMLIFNIPQNTFTIKNITGVSVYSMFFYKNGYIYSVSNSTNVIAKINLDTGIAETVAFDKSNLVASVMDNNLGIIYLIMKDNTIKKYNIANSEIIDFTTLSGYSLSSTTIAGNIPPPTQYMINNKIYYITRGSVNNTTKRMLITIDFDTYTVSSQIAEQINTNETIFTEFFLFDNLTNTFYYLADDKLFVKINVNTTEYEENSIVISTKIKYSTKLISSIENIVGDLVTYFSDAWIFTNNFITNIETYYGDGTSWIKFKN